MAKARIGVIGVGKIGGHHLRIYNELAQEYGNIELSAFSRTSKEGVDETLKKLAEIGCEARGYDSYLEMLDREKLDFVDICSPNESHLENIKYAMSKGIENILCEKPVAFYTQLEQAYETAELAEKNNVEIAVNMNMIAVRKAARSRIKGYSVLEETAPFEIKWSSGKNQIYTERIEDFMPHILSIIPRAEPEKIEKLEDGGVEIKCRNGTIILSCSEDNKRQWTFYDGSFEHNFSYGWQNGAPTIKYWTNGTKPKIFVIEDPLKTSLGNFIQGIPLARFKEEGIESLVKISGILK